MYILGTYHICKAKGQDKTYKSGKGGIQDCKFPFKQSGMEHSGCAPSLQKGNGPRCATEVDKQGNLKNWARCNKFCIEDPGTNRNILFFHYDFLIQKYFYLNILMCIVYTVILTIN